MKLFKKNRTFVIAEAGINHNGKFALAKKLIAAAKAAGADAVKFQAFKTEELIIRDAAKAEHVKGKKSFFEMVKSWELKDSDYQKLAKFAKAQGIIFFASVFGEASLQMLKKIEVPLYKIASSDLNNLPLLEEVARTRKPIIVSTGMGTLSEIKQAVKILEKNHNELGILHCVSLYPPRAEEFHLEKIKVLQKTFPRYTIGYSDHSLDIFVPVSTIVLGARIIEKHFTFDKKMPGPDQQSSADPAEFKKMVQEIRYLEKAMNFAPKFFLEKREQEMKKAFRRSLVTNKAVKKGQIITEDLLGIKRPGTGIPPTKITQVIGRRTKRALPAGVLIKLTDLA